jgi:hypothetical protein
MGAVLANSHGMTATFPCRFCFYGGTKASRATIDGFGSIMQASIPAMLTTIVTVQLIPPQLGAPRTVQRIMQEVDRQLTLAEKDKTNQITIAQRASGVQDLFAEDAITIMLEQNDDYCGKGIDPARQTIPPAQIPEKMAELHASLAAGGRLKNPLLELNGRISLCTRHID